MKATRYTLSTDLLRSAGIPGKVTMSNDCTGKATFYKIKLEESKLLIAYVDQVCHYSSIVEESEFGYYIVYDDGGWTFISDDIDEVLEFIEEHI